MEGKVLLQDLAQTLAAKRNIKSKEAETFLKVFFETISDAIVQDKIVKIKGLGTFKMIDVQDRESVNVNTGERIVIPGHSKISFTPDTELKDQVNKPFALFQTVVINEGTSLDDMENFESPVDLPESLDTQYVEEVQESPTVEISQIVESAPEIEDVSEVQDVEEAQDDSEVQNVEEVQDVPETTQVVDEPKWWHISPAMLALLFALLWIVLLLGYFIGKNNLFNIDQMVHKSDPVAVVKVDTVYVDKTDEQDTLYIQRIEDSLRIVIEEEIRINKEHPKTKTLQADNNATKPIERKKQSPVVFEIVGHKGVRSIKWGDYLLKIVREEYGTEDALKYVISYNKFTDPNNLPVGTEVKLPKLREK